MAMEKSGGERFERAYASRNPNARRGIGPDGTMISVSGEFEDTKDTEARSFSEDIRTSPTPKDVARRKW